MLRLSKCVLLTLSTSWISCQKTETIKKWFSAKTSSPKCKTKCRLRKYFPMKITLYMSSSAASDLTHSAWNFIKVAMRLLQCSIWYHSVLFLLSEAVSKKLALWVSCLLAYDTSLCCYAAIFYMLSFCILFAQCVRMSVHPYVYDVETSLRWLWLR